MLLTRNAHSSRIFQRVIATTNDGGTSEKVQELQIALTLR
jgi:hypothetical protein